MGRRPRPRVAALFALLPVAVALVASPRAHGEDVAGAQRQRDQLATQISALTTQLNELEASAERTRDELQTYRDRAAKLEKAAATAEVRLRDRARSNFIHGDAGTLELLLSAEGPEGAVERAGMLAALSRRDVAARQSSTALRTQIEQNHALLTAKAQSLAAMEEEMRRRAGELQQSFAAANALYGELKTREERQRRIANDEQRGVYACIFSGAYEFQDNWGEERSGGRTHEGNDVFAAYGAEVYAITSGAINDLQDGGLGGTALYLAGDDGTLYYYAHLSDYAPGITRGMHVEAGQLIAFNGDTGNASEGAPHVHFEAHPGGGGAVDPYPWLSSVC